MNGARPEQAELSKDTDMSKEHALLYIGSDLSSTPLVRIHSELSLIHI